MGWVSENKSCFIGGPSTSKPEYVPVLGSYLLLAVEYTWAIRSGLIHVSSLGSRDRLTHRSSLGFGRSIVRICVSVLGALGVVRGTI